MTDETQAKDPVWPGDDAEKEKELRDGPALCLSGGGYRAMLFHVGTLWRLNELAYLPKLQRISSVSGGSITAGLLGLNWGQLDFGPDGIAKEFGKALVEPIRRMSETSIDVKSVFFGVFGPGSVSDQVEKQYRKHLFGDKTLQDLPDSPRFVINATNVQSGALWRFSKPYMGDWKVGRAFKPTTSLATAVTASSAFPPFLSPVELKLAPGQIVPASVLPNPPYTTDVVLSDGGVYDNMGLETVWKSYKTVLVSDAGAPFKAEPKPHGDWPRHAVRVLGLIDNQVRSLRKHQTIEAFKAGRRQGAYWGIGGDISKYSAPDKLPCPLASSQALATVSTRLTKLDAITQKKLINWGYAICDAGMRSHVDTSLPAPKKFPYEDVAV